MTYVKKRFCLFYLKKQIDYSKSIDRLNAFKNAEPYWISLWECTWGKSCDYYWNLKKKTETWQGFFMYTHNVDKISKRHFFHDGNLLRRLQKAIVFQGDSLAFFWISDSKSVKLTLSVYGTVCTYVNVK